MVRLQCEGKEFKVEALNCTGVVEVMTTLTPDKVD